MCRKNGERVTILVLALGFLAFGGGCSDDDSVEYYDPLTDECDRCLSPGEEEGCGSLWSACDEEQACSDFVLCQLRARCYEKQPDSDCESQVGCVMSSAASTEARENAGEFETCARTTCAEACGYRAP